MGRGQSGKGWLECMWIEGLLQGLRVEAEEGHSLGVGRRPSGIMGSPWPFKPGIVGPGSNGNRDCILGFGEDFHCWGLGQMELQFLLRPAQLRTLSEDRQHKT